MEKKQDELALEADYYKSSYDECRRQLQELTEVPQKVLQEVDDLIGDLEQRVKFYEKELSNLRQENQQLRLSNDQQFRESIANMNEAYESADQIKQENEMLRIQLQQSQEENDQILAKLAQQDEVINKNEELRSKLESMQEELEASQKACDYYQTDMLPEIRKQTDILGQKILGMEKENQRLIDENKGLQGSIGD